MSAGQESSVYNTVHSDEWDTMTREERVNVCKISDDQADAMSTADLLQAVLENPFLIDLYAFDIYREGFEHVYSQFPELKQLVERRDFGAALIDCYNSVPVVDNASCNSKDVYDSLYILSLLEILITQPEVTNNLKSEQLDSLISIAQEKYAAKQNMATVYGGSLETFYRGLYETDDSSIARAARAMVTTPNGSNVVVIDNSFITDWTPAERAQLNAQTEMAYPNATRLRDASKKYNCHSYAWYSTSAANRYWINDPSVYMTDGSYVQTGSSAVGNKVYWKSGSSPVHSGILALNSVGNPWISCNSKWGQLGLYNHALDDCPYSGQRTYWTR